MSICYSDNNMYDTYQTVGLQRNIFSVFGINFHCDLVAAPTGQSCDVDAVVVWGEHVAVGNSVQEHLISVEHVLQYSRCIHV